jgi:hypothetical protein
MNHSKRFVGTSIGALSRLGYDPIEELTKNHERILKQIERQEKVSNGQLTQLNGDGKTINYNAEVHMNLYDKLTKISEALLRYGYARVPENNDEKVARNNSLTINLTAKGDKYIINASEGFDGDQPA